MVTDVNRTELLRLIQEEDAQVVDVLPEREYSESHIPGALSSQLRRLNAHSVAVPAARQTRSGLLRAPWMRRGFELPSGGHRFGTDHRRGLDRSARGVGIRRRTQCAHYAQDLLGPAHR